MIYETRYLHLQGLNAPGIQLRSLLHLSRSAVAFGPTRPDNLSLKPLPYPHYHPVRQKIFRIPATRQIKRSLNGSPAKRMPAISTPTRTPRTREGGAWVNPVRYPPTPRGSMGASGFCLKNLHSATNYNVKYQAYITKENRQNIPRTIPPETGKKGPPGPNADFGMHPALQSSAGKGGPSTTGA
jgi:hypothetical protein